MATFRIHCVTLADPWGQSFFTELEKLFTQVCEHPQSGFDDASVFWWTHRPVHQAANEPFVWLLGSKADSLIRKVYKVRVPDNNAGLTAVRATGNISEIYLDHQANQSSIGQAKMAFHELMHNKLQVGNTLHNADFGLGLNKELLDLKTAISATLDAENIRKMAPALKTPVPQWAPPFRQK